MVSLSACVCHKDTNCLSCHVVTWQHDNSNRHFKTSINLYYEKQRTVNVKFIFGLNLKKRAKYGLGWLLKDLMYLLCFKHICHHPVSANLHSATQLVKKPLKNVIPPVQFSLIQLYSKGTLDQTKSIIRCSSRPATLLQWTEVQKTQRPNTPDKCHWNSKVSKQLAAFIYC